MPRCSTGSTTPAPAPDTEQPGAEDDTLTLLFLCCHPALSPPSQVALTLRAVAGLTTAEIARAFLTPEPTVAQRISRAKRTVAGADFAMPAEADRASRLGAVLHVLYLVFNEGYTATSGPDLHRPDLTGDAVRLVRQVHRLLPDDGEVAGLLALMLITEARRPTRTRPDGGLVPLAEQDRRRWDRAALAEGIALIEATMSHAPVGPYQLQAAIAAVHGEAERAEDTDWSQIAELYRVLVGGGAGPDGHAQPGGGSRHGRRAAGRARPAVHPGRCRPARRAPPGAGRPRAPARDGGRPRRGARGVRGGGPRGGERARAAVPAGACRPVALIPGCAE